MERRQAMGVPVLAVVDVLGLKRDKAGSHPLRLADAMERGLPTEALERLSRLVAPSDASFKYTIVPKATLSRSKGAKRLSPANSERVARYARLWTETRRVWKSDEAARGFLWRPHPLLEGRRPIDVARTEVGARLVEDVLGGIEFGTAV